jgi:hydrogenase maturation protein HypF
LNEGRIAVIGLGHALLGDDALGVAVVQALDRTYVVPPSVAVIDAGSCGLDLVHHLLDRDHVIFVDALAEAAPAGTLRTVGRDELWAAKGAGVRLAPHEPAIHDALALASLAGRGPRDAVLVGVVPESLDVGVELSPAVSRALPRAVGEVVRLLSRLGVELSHREKSDERAASETGVRIELRGVVQGVGLRPWMFRRAAKLGLTGSVVNTLGSVVVEAFGERAAIEELVAALKAELPRAARVSAMQTTAIAFQNVSRFSIEKSEHEGERVLAIPADLAMCDACRREVDDPSDRRHGYAFTSCTDCGPRHSIVVALPYDRERTTMARFALCPDCAREYADPADRRYHAETIACTRCGPEAWIEATSGERLGVRDPLGYAAERIRAGDTIAVQGLGGFHLACDATQESAVGRLRARKRRDEKPFAVMVASAVEAAVMVDLDDASLDALESPAHPIVLAPRRQSAVAANVAPGSTRLGVFLPYTPLHHLLAASVGRPMVLTSGNLHGEPIAVTRDDARRELAGVADAFLLHDRPIARRVEDSVVVAARNGTRVLRRGRGLAPTPVRLPCSAPQPILATGGHLKNTACLVLGDQAYLTPHLGDLVTCDAERAYADDVESFERLLGAHAEIVAHDLHPDYASTHYAVRRAPARRIAVQHHLAHVLAAVAELGIEGPVVAAVFDGSGLGTDGTLWGGEILRVDGLEWSRPFSTRPLLLGGGENSIREVWRTALALLFDTFGEETRSMAARLPLFAGVPGNVISVVLRMLEERVATVQARGIGRYFDAFGALFLDRARAAFEGQVAMLWEEIAVPEDLPPYPFLAPRAPAAGREVTADSEFDLRPALRAALADRFTGAGAATIAARFHRTIVEATAQMLERVVGDASTIVLTGGCFQNMRLDTALRKRLSRLRVAAAREVPVNDGGIALGQAWAAVQMLRDEEK